jgi:hypothetical protein
MSIKWDDFRILAGENIALGGRRPQSETKARKRPFDLCAQRFQRSVFYNFDLYIIIYRKAATYLQVRSTGHGAPKTAHNV